jgi:hypothetical protein
MKPLQSLWRTVKLAALALICWAATSSILLAAEDDPSKNKGSGDYTLAYFLLILGVVLGMLVVLRSSNRRERESPEGYVQKNILKEE